MFIRSNSTSSFPGEWIWQGSTGYIFVMPDSTSPTNNGLGIIDSDSTTYQGFLLSPRVVSGASTGPASYVSVGPNTFSALYYNGITYSDIVTNGANYLYAAGNSSGQAPGIQALGVDTDIDIQVLPKGAGALMFNYAGTTMGAGGTATLGTVGGSGPTATAQAKWLKVKIQGGTYFLPAWSS